MYVTLYIRDFVYLYDLFKWHPAPVHHATRSRLWAPTMHCIRQYEVFWSTGKEMFRAQLVSEPTTNIPKLLLVAMTTNFILTSPMGYSWWFVKMATYQIKHVLVAIMSYIV